MAFDLRPHGGDLDRAVRQRQPDGGARLAELHWPVTDVFGRYFSVADGPAQVWRVGQFCHSVVLGFTLGAAVVIALGQLPNALGLDIPGKATALDSLMTLLAHMREFDSASLGLALATLLVGVVFKRWLPLAGLNDCAGQCQPGGVVLAAGVWACTAGAVVCRKPAALQPVATGSGGHTAPAAQCSGGGDAGGW